MDYLTSERIERILALFDKREAEITRLLAHYAEHGPDRVYKLLLREYTKERVQMARRRAWLNSFVCVAHPLEINTRPSIHRD